MRAIATRGLAAAAALALLGCAALPPAPGKPPPDPPLPARASVEGVPFFPQQEDQCGPAALAMALAWSGLETGPDALRPWVYTESLRGSLQPALTAAARRAGRIALAVTGEEALRREIAAGHPVIVLQNLGLDWAPLWHYAVVIGYDRDRDEVRVHSGTEADRRVAGELFRRTWRRAGEWGLVVLPPERLPATASESAASRSSRRVAGCSSRAVTDSPVTGAPARSRRDRVKMASAPLRRSPASAVQPRAACSCIRAISPL